MKSNYGAIPKRAVHPLETASDYRARQRRDSALLIRWACRVAVAVAVLVLAGNVLRWLVT